MRVFLLSTPKLERKGGKKLDAEGDFSLLQWEREKTKVEWNNDWKKERYEKEGLQAPLEGGGSQCKRNLCKKKIDILGSRQKRKGLLF